MLLLAFGSPKILITSTLLDDILDDNEGEGLFKSLLNMVSLSGRLLGPEEAEVKADGREEVVVAEVNRSRLG